MCNVVVLISNQGFFFGAGFGAGGSAHQRIAQRTKEGAHQKRTKHFSRISRWAHQERTKDFSNFTLIPKMYLLLVYNSSHIEIETPSSAETSFLLRAFEKIVDFFYHLFMMLSISWCALGEEQ